VAQVSLDGLQVSMPHALALEEAALRIEAAARDLSEGSLKRQNPTITKPAKDRVVLAGGRDGSHFEAEIRVAENQVVVAIKGALALSFLEVTLAGGAPGVRQRVQDAVERALRERLAAA
jgi:hypothetical protein